MARDLNKFIEMMRSLNYPRQISIDSFDTPNFELVADVLCYLVQRVDPSIVMTDRIGTENDRIQFLNGATVGLAKSINLCLDARRIYAADANSVQELLKVAQYLRQALELTKGPLDSDDAEHSDTNLSLVHHVGSLVKEIADSGARLIDLIRNEVRDGKERQNTSKFLNSFSGIPRNGSEKEHIESRIKLLTEGTRDELERIDKQIKMLISTGKGAEEKIRKRKIELERNSKHLESLQGVRPAFMDDYEKIEEELRIEYDRFVVRLRNVDFLEAELKSLNLSAMKQSNEAERAVKRMQKKFREEELRILKGGDRSGDEDSNSNQGSHPNHKESTISKDNTIRDTFASGRSRTKDFGDMNDQDEAMMSISVQDISRIDIVPSAGTTPRDQSSVGRSDGSPSCPSGQSFEDAMTGTDMTGSVSFNSDDDF